MSKTLIFYSNYCQYSKNLIEEITKANIRDEFLLVCIDSNNYNIPKFVTKVPMIFSKTENRIYVEDEIVQYINNVANSKKNSSTNNQNVEYYSQVEMDSKFSDNFSFLNDENQKRSFVFLNEDDTFNDNIIKQSAQLKDDNQNNKLDSSAIEKYMMKRDSDFNNAMQTMQTMQTMQRKNI